MDSRLVASARLTISMGVTRLETEAAKASKGRYLASADVKALAEALTVANPRVTTAAEDSTEVETKVETK
jgi:hypothetical protein